MVVKELSDKYRFEKGQEESLGMLTQGRRLSDNQMVEVLAIKKGLDISREGLIKATQDNQQIIERMLPQVLVMTEVGISAEGQYYIVSEATDFPSLNDIIKSKKKMDAKDVIRIGYQLAYLLHQIGSMEMQHLDLSDHNVFVSMEDDQLKIRVRRIGFRHFVPEYSPKDSKTVFWGTPEIMAPEICAGKGISPTSDQYALGILLYEMIAGKPPFLSKSPKTTIKRQVYEKPLPIHLVRPSFTRVKDIEKVLTKLLHKDPTQRYQDTTELMEALGTVASDMGADVTIEGERSEAATLEVKLDAAPQEAQPEAQSKPEPEAKEEESAPVRETMMFTGVADEIEQVVKAKAEGAQSEGAQQTQEDIERAPTREMSSPNEQAGPDKEGAKPEEAQNKEPAHKETIAIVREDLEAAQMAPSQQPTQEQTKSPTTTQTGDDWFVNDSSELAPPDVFSEQKESKMFWIIISVVILVVGIGAIFLFGGGKKAPVVDSTPPKPVVTKPVAAPVTHKKAVRPAPVRHVAVPPKNAAVAAKNPNQPATPAGVKTPSNTANNNPNNKAAQPTAKKAAAPVVPAHLPIVVKKPKPEKANKQPEKPKAVAVKSKQPPVKKTKPKVIKHKRRKPARRVVKRRKRKSTKSSLIPKGMTPHQAMIYYFKAGRKAEGSGDYRKAIRNYRKALRLDPTNNLIPRLIKRAQAKLKK